MALTFANIDRTNNAHIIAADKGLCLGYVTRPAYGREIVYAETQDGKFFTSGERDYSPSFDCEKWIAIDTIPADAEFIGHYKL